MRWGQWTLLTSFMNEISSVQADYSGLNVNFAAGRSISFLRFKNAGSITHKCRKTWLLFLPYFLFVQDVHAVKHIFVRPGHIRLLPHNHLYFVNFFFHLHHGSQCIKHMVPVGPS